MDGPGLTVGAVARRLGVAVTTLRTWHQRYGLGPSAHEPGRHRRYTGSDLARLDLMRRLTAAGVPPHEAAGLALAAPEPGGATRDGSVAPRPARRDGGGWAIPVGRSGPAARGVARAAVRMDAAALLTLLDQAIRDRGVIRAWTEVVVPVLTGVGSRHAATGRLIEVEHLLSRCVSSCLAAAPRPRTDQPPRVLLGCADEEQHTLALEALAASLAQAGVPHRMLGARVPVPAWRDAIRRTGPTAVVIWSQTPATADPDKLLQVRDIPDRAGLVVAVGPGWGSLPPGVATATSLPEAVPLLAGVAGVRTGSPRSGEP